jgi:hypothetical protein
MFTESTEEYAQTLIDAGFTVYDMAKKELAPVSWFHYSKAGLFGTFDFGTFDGPQHTMPIAPTKEWGSSILMPESSNAMSVECAESTARKTNHDKYSGIVHNNAEPWGIGTYYIARQHRKVSETMMDFASDINALQQWKKQVKNGLTQLGFDHWQAGEADRRVVALAARHVMSEFLVDEIAPEESRFVVTCLCHNPDGNSDGRMDFSGPTVADASDGWYDHFAGIVVSA